MDDSKKLETIESEWNSFDFNLFYVVQKINQKRFVAEHGQFIGCLMSFVWKELKNVRRNEKETS